MTYADLDVAPGFLPVCAFDPDKDYESPGKEDKPDAEAVLMP